MMGGCTNHHMADLGVGGLGAGEEEGGEVGIEEGGGGTVGSIVATNRIEKEAMMVVVGRHTYKTQSV